MDFPLAELQSAHQELMDRYVAVLDEVRSARWLMPRKQAATEEPQWLTKVPVWLRKPLSLLVKPAPNSTHGKSFALRSLVHLFVEGHIRKKLKELSEGYITIRARASADAKELRDWCKECSDVCEKMAGTLATWASVEGAFRLLWPFALGGFTAWLGVKDIWEAVKKLEFTAYVFAFLVLFFPLIYLLIFMSASFGYKREMFIPGFDANERPFDPSVTAPQFNIYLLEDRLFALLHRRKSTERSWDTYLAALGALTFGSVPLLMILTGDKPDLILWLASGFFWVIAIWALVKKKRRQWL